MRFPLCTAGTTSDVTLPAQIQPPGQGHCASQARRGTGQQGGTETYLANSSGRVANKGIQGKDAGTDDPQGFWRLCKGAVQINWLTAATQKRANRVCYSVKAATNCKSYGGSAEKILRNSEIASWLPYFSLCKLQEQDPRQGADLKIPQLHCTRPSCRAKGKLGWSIARVGNLVQAGRGRQADKQAGGKLRRGWSACQQMSGLTAVRFRP